VKKGNDAYRPVNDKTLAEINRRNKDYDPRKGGYQPSTTTSAEKEAMKPQGSTSAQVVSARIKQKNKQGEQQDDFSEAQHPRSSSGEFGSKGESSKKSSSSGSSKKDSERSKLTSQGYKKYAEKNGHEFYRHPKEKGSVVLTPEGSVVANE
jgi:hypothetical protein